MSYSSTAADTLVYIKIQKNEESLNTENTETTENIHSIPILFDNSQQKHSEINLMKRIKHVIEEYDPATYDICHENGADLIIAHVLTGETLLLVRRNLCDGSLTKALSTKSTDGNDSDDDGSDKKTFESVRDNMVFLIDCSPNMLEPMSLNGEKEEKTTGLQIALDF